MDIPKGDIWIFGYGSLMWQPDFPYTDSQPALLKGYHRSLCLYSFQHRGTPEVPGLVFGLDRGGSCRGVALKVACKNAEDVLSYLHDREMLNRVYLPKWLPVQLPSEKVPAYAFIADRRHKQYTGRLTDNDTVKYILQGYGKRGHCLEYLQSTLRHLDELGIKDEPLRRLVTLAKTASA